MHIFTIKSRQEFLDIQNNCKRPPLKTNKIIVLCKKIDDREIEKSKIKDYSKFGICVTKKIDKRAVVRNRIKRLLREGIRKILKEHEEIIVNNYKYEIIAKKDILNFSFYEIYKDILFLIEYFKKNL